MRHERGIAARHLPGNTAQSDFFHFNDVWKYDGKVAKGRYLAMVYKMYNASIWCHLSNEVKNQGAKRLAWDVSYKEANLVCQYIGNPVFKILVTAIYETIRGSNWFYITISKISIFL